MKPKLEQLEGREVPAGFIPAAQDHLLLVGSDAGTVARVWQFATDIVNDPEVYYDSDPATPVYESTFTGGVRVAVGRAQDALGGPVTFYAPGPGRPTEIRVAYPAWGPHLSQQAHTETFTPFEASFTGGAFVTTADFSGQSVLDVVVSPDLGGGPRVRILRNGDPSAVVADFLGIDDPAFRGGVRTAVGDVNRDGVPDLIVAAGTGGGPRIAVWDGAAFQTGATPRRLCNDFFAFEPDARLGAFVAVADVNNDGYADVVAGPGRGGTPRVVGFSGLSLLSNQIAPVANFYAGDPNERGGVRIIFKDLNGDDQADLIAGSGAVASTLTAYAGGTIPADGPPPVAKQFAVREPFTYRELGFRGGVFLG